MSLLSLMSLCPLSTCHFCLPLVPRFLYSESCAEHEVAGLVETIELVACEEEDAVGYKCFEGEGVIPPTQVGASGRDNAVTKAYVYGKQ